MLRDVEIFIKVDIRSAVNDHRVMNWLGLLVSFAFVFGFIGLAQLLLKRGTMSVSATRKVIHIGVSHWWLLAMVFFDRWEFAIIGPVAFVLINLMSYILRLFPAMEHEKRSKNLGTIYFPIALTVMVLVTWGGPIPIWMGGLAILVLGYGDGLASLAGERSKGVRFSVFGNSKSLRGTLVMFVVASIVAAVFLVLFAGPESLVLAETSRPLGIALTSLLLASVATGVELLTPLGVDNLTVPFATVALLYLL
jgi:phytol kinase